MSSTHAIIIGKFLPPHKGHEFLIRFAQSLFPSLTIVVDCTPHQELPTELRVKWLRELFPSVEVVGLTQPTPQEPSEHPQFWEFWKNTLQTASSKPITHVVASETYGVKLAEALGATFIPCNPSRDTVNISATRVKQDPKNHWHQLINPAKPYFTKLIRLMGPESTGKSTLAKNLAQKLDCPYVPEYAKDFIIVKGGVTQEDMPLFATGQTAQIQAALEVNQRNPYVICDTCPLTTKVWTNTLYGTTLEITAPHTFDLTFLIYPTNPWVGDVHRNVLKDSHTEDSRLKMFNDMLKELQQTGCNPIILKGSFEENEAQALEAINNLTFNLP